MKVVGAYLAFCALLIGGFGMFFFTNPQYLSTNQFIFQGGSAVLFDDLAGSSLIETTDCGNNPMSSTTSLDPFTPGNRLVDFFSSSDGQAGTNTINIENEQVDISIDSACGNTAAVFAYGFNKPQSLEDAQRLTLNILSYEGDFEIRFFALEAKGLSIAESLSMLFDESSDGDAESLNKKFGKGWAFFNHPIEETGDITISLNKPVTPSALNWRNVRLFGIVIFGNGELSFNRPRLIP